MLTKQAETGFDITRLKEYREKAKLTQAELSKRSGVHAVLISNYEKGRHTPHPKTAAKLEAVLSACFPDGLPMEKGMYADGLRRAACPHCGAPNCHTLEVCIPGIELQCISCSRVFRLDAKGRAYVPEHPGQTTPHDRPSYGRDRVMSEEARANISAGQLRRHARERAELED